MVDIQPTTSQPISDDQELAKVLAGVSGNNDASMQFEETGGASTPTPAMTPTDNQVIDQPVDQPAEQPAVTPIEEPIAPPAPTGASDDLAPIKSEAINELRPLVDKLNLPAEEKFDTYLLLLRSTDDRTLIAPAHAAAQSIEDEAKKAQALLDVIKEIDYLSNPQQNQAAS